MTQSQKPPPFITATDAAVRSGSRYPAPHNEICNARSKYILGDAFGLSQFGVNLVNVPAGSWSSQRHWHENEEEFIYVLSGELTLVTDDGEHLLKPGMCAGFKTGPDSGHCLKNLSDAPAQYLEMGTRSNDEVAWYNDIDLKVEVKNRQMRYMRKDGSAI